MPSATSADSSPLAPSRTMSPPETVPGPSPRVIMVLKRAGGLGGMQIQARRVSQGLLERGVPVSLLTQAPPHGEAPVWWTASLPVQFLPAGSQWSFAAHVYRYLCRRRKDYDIVHVHGLGLEACAAIAARRVTGRPLVIKPSTAGKGTTLDLFARWTDRLPLFSRLAWQRVDRWVSISDRTAADLSRLGIDAATVVRIPNGVDRSQHYPLPPPEREALRTRLGLSRDDLLICTGVRLLPHKRVDLLIRAFQTVAPRFPTAQLWVAGDGEQSGELESLVASSPHRDRVRLLGPVKTRRVARIFQAADIFALLSLWEGLSNALLEAMACALPPVVTDVSGMADLVEDGVSGLVIPPDDEPAARDALASLLQDADQRRALGGAALRTIEAEYSLDRTVDRLLALYRGLAPP